MSVKTEVDVEALRRLLPLGADSASVNTRERLFKEFVVRSAHLIDMGVGTAGKAKSRPWDGTLNQDAILPLLGKALAQAEVFRTCDDSDIECLVQQAFEVARRVVEPVSASDQAFIDMNQWHVLVFYFVTGLSLLSSGQWRNGPIGRTMAQEDFANLCRHLTSSRWGADMLPEVVEQMKDWAKTPTAAAWELEATEGVFYFTTVAEWLVNRQLGTWRSVTDEMQSRKRAFQLLQLMNNTPSLPNSVPGKLTPRATCGAKTSLLAMPASVWQTTNRRFFS